MRVIEVVASPIGQTHFHGSHRVEGLEVSCRPIFFFLVSCFDYVRYSASSASSGPASRRI
jgi:hypothetical protein